MSGIDPDNNDNRTRDPAGVARNNDHRTWNTRFYYRHWNTGSLEYEIVAQSLETGEVTALFPGLSPVYLATGHLVYLEPNLGLMARARGAIERWQSVAA